MYLIKLSLINFKNYQEAALELNPRINVFVGKNGSGKTNMLDAIHVLSLTKSALASSDLACVKSGESYFMVKGSFEKQEREVELMVAVQQGLKKVFKENQLDYDKLSDHIGKYPIVLIVPDDADLIKEGSESRRKYMDSIISQLDNAYLEALIQYNFALKQRNSLLKMFYESGKTDWVALEVYDRMLIKNGALIYTKRQEFIQQFIPSFKKFYTFLAGVEEDSYLVYESELHDIAFEKGLSTSRQKDLVLQRTTFGIHRDDIGFYLGKNDLKRFGSQGQQKSFLIALKLAQFEVLEQTKGFKPLLLLDDIFDKLDDFRIQQLLQLIKTSFGQIFITDARPDRTAGLLAQIDVPARIFEIEKGTVKIVK